MKQGVDSSTAMNDVETVTETVTETMVDMVIETVVETMVDHMKHYRMLIFVVQNPVNRVKIVVGKDFAKNLVNCVKIVGVKDFATSGVCGRHTVSYNCVTPGQKP